MASHLRGQNVTSSRLMALATLATLAMEAWRGNVCCRSSLLIGHGSHSTLTTASSFFFFQVAYATLTKTISAVTATNPAALEMNAFCALAASASAAILDAGLDAAFSAISRLTSSGGSSGVAFVALLWGGNSTNSENNKPSNTIGTIMS